MDFSFSSLPFILLAFFSQTKLEILLAREDRGKGPKNGIFLLQVQSLGLVSARCTLGVSGGQEGGSRFLAPQRQTKNSKKAYGERKFKDTFILVQNIFGMHAYFFF